MDRLYDEDDYASHPDDHSSDPSHSSASFAEEEPRRHHHHHHHHHPHQPYQHSNPQHRTPRYDAQQLRSQHPEHYAHPSRRADQASSTLRPWELRRRSSPPSSDLSSGHSQSAHVHRHTSHSHGHDADDDGYFLSAVSGAPSLEVEDLRHTHNSSDEDAAAAADADGEGFMLDEDFAVPTWSQGSRLGERRIHQAVDQETMELDAEEVVWVPRLGLASAGVAAASPQPTATGSDVERGEGGGADRWLLGPPPLAPTSGTSASLFPQEGGANLAGPPRMKEAALLADPRNRLLDLVITNTAASVTLGEIETTMQWSTRYEPMYGALLEYLQSYQSIFVVSPVDDRVRLRRDFSTRTSQATRESRRRSPQTSHAQQQHQSQQHPQGQRTSRALRSGRSRAKDRAPSAPLRSPSAVDRRSGKPSLPSAEALAAHIGSVSYSCVGEHLNLDVLETVYRRRGYDTAMVHAVLHVTSENDFNLFLFASGAVVWWGMDRKDHWMVDDDFLCATTHIADGVEYRYVQSEIDALFPIWCSFEVDEQCDDMQVASPLGIQPAAVKPALERLSKVLCFDHYLVPANEPARSLVMLTFSHSLGRSARVDYFEFVTKWSHRHILSIPAEFSGLLDYFSTKRRIAKLEGEIEVAQLAIQSIHDTPEVLWEVPWLQAYYDMAEQQNTAQSRLSWFASRSDTLLEQLSHIKARRHRLFMLGSDVFLIVILILDVMFMTSRLVAKMYFKVEEEE